MVWKLVLVHFTNAIIREIAGPTVCQPVKLELSPSNLSSQRTCMINDHSGNEVQKTAKSITCWRAGATH